MSHFSSQLSTSTFKRIFDLLQTFLLRFRDLDGFHQSPVLQPVPAVHLRASYDAAARHRLPGQELETLVTDHGCPWLGLYAPLVVR